MGTCCSDLPLKGQLSKQTEWTYKLYYSPRADKTDSVVPISHLGRIELQKSERILQITLYKTPLNENQYTNVLLYHAFAVIKTSDWW